MTPSVSTKVGTGARQIQHLCFRRASVVGREGNAARCCMSPLLLYENPIALVLSSFACQLCECVPPCYRDAEQSWSHENRCWKASMEQLGHAELDGAAISVVEGDRHGGTGSVRDAGYDLLERYDTTVLLQKIELLPKCRERQVQRAIAAGSVDILDDVVIGQYQRAAGHPPCVPGEGNEQPLGRWFEQRAH